MKLWAKVMMITTLTLFVSIFMNQGWYGPGLAQADVTSATPPTTASGTNWGTPANVLTQDATYTTFTGTSGTYLQITGFGFAIPAGSTINGVQATVWGTSSGSNATNRTIRVNLTTNGTAAAGTNKTQALTTSNASYALGTTSDLWGATLTPANVNTSTFGVLIRDNDTTSSGTFSMDYVSLTITYTLEANKPTITTFTVPATSSSLTISDIALIATDNIAVTGYLINESSAPPAAAAVNLGTAPTSYTAAAAGPVTLYAWARDAAGNVNNVFAGQTCTITLAAPNPILHNSANLGTKYGTWGVAGGTYGEFVCTTCHNKSTNNVKRVVESIPATIGPPVVKPVIFNNMTGFGDDSVARATSFRICEVCHTQTTAHQYNTANAPQSNDLSHPNGNCTQCHEHSAGFKAGGHLVPLWGTTAGHTGCASGIGCHTNSNPAAPYPTTGDPVPPPDCRACHTKADPTVSSNGCGSCHGLANGTGEPSGAAYPDRVGSHPVHTPLALCTSCHSVGGTGGNADHGKGNRGANPAVVNLDASNTWNGTTCSTASCHSDVYSSGTVSSPAWGTAAGCEACHTTPIASTGPATGSHAAHNETDCSQCHTGATSYTTVPSANHADGDINVNSGYPATTKHAAGTYAADAKCSTASCHANVYGAGTVLTPQWGTTAGCEACHSVVIGVNGPATGSHTAHAGRACITCHAAGTTATSVPSTGHNNNNIDVANVGYPGTVAKHAADSGYSSCSNLYCHSDGTKDSGYTSKSGNPTWGGSAASCVTCHGGHYNTGNPAFSSLSTGRHRKHLRQYAAITCNICHAATVSNNTTISDPTKHVNSQINVSFTGVPATGGIPAFSNNDHAPGVQTGTCSTVYCHSNAQLQQGGANLVFRNLTGGKMWFTAGTLNCSGCHGSTSSPNINPVTSLSGKHGSHLDLLVNPNMGKIRACGDCHINGGTTVRLNHVNGLANYSGTMAGGQNNLKLSTGRCSSVYCHSDGKGAFKNMSANNWFSANTLTCNGCHGDAGSATTLSGKHNEHINFTADGGNFGCIECHASTVVSSIAINTLGNHVNALKNFSGAKAYKTGFVAGAGTCSTYCHTDGKGGAPEVAVTWTGAAIDCSGCHAMGAIVTGGHQAHLTHGGITCANCHSATTADSATITGATHIDGTVSMQQGGSFNSQPVTFTPAAGSCNNISCHGGSNADWLPPGQANCETCHPKANLSGHHSIHMGALDLTSSAILYNMTANRTPVQTDAVLTHGFGCANCHPLNAVNHLNGAIDVDMSSKGVVGTSSIRFLNSTTAGSLPQYTGGACSNIYCHSNASRVANELVYKPTPAWVGGSFSGDRCAACHDNQPATGAHAAHAVGNHTNNDVPHSVMIAGNIYNGKSGKVGISNRANTAHGNPNNSTTIGCYICHQATVISKANDKNTKCAVCHYSGNPFGAALKGNAAINNIKNHVNGSREIQFPAIKVISKAQIRPESFKFYSGVWKRTTYKNMSTLSFDTAKTALDTATMWHPSSPMESNCTNIACHNGKTVAWNMANWNDPNKCMDCHNQL